MQNEEGFHSQQDQVIEEPCEEELDVYAELMEDQLVTEGRALRIMIEPLLQSSFASFEDICLGAEILTAYQNDVLPHEFALEIQQHLVCCQICIEELSFLE